MPNRLKSDSNELCDRLSELSDSLIIVILSLLPMEDVVRTTILSKRWKDLWTTVPCLIFWDYKYGLGVDQSFINRALSLWKGIKILKFSIDFTFHESLTSDLDSWLHFAIEKQVEELFVSLTESKSSSFCSVREYYPPQPLYSCSSIKKLSLLSCELKICKSVQWDQLKSLTIETAYLLSEHEMEQILCGAPQLEVLNLRVLESSTFSNIRSSSLKMLKIHRFPVALSYDVAKDIMLTIWAPNLDCLEFLGVSYRSCLLNVPSLTCMILRFRERDYVDERDSGGFSLDEMVEQVLLSIGHVEKLTLSDWCFKVLIEMKKKDMFIPFSNVKFLKLNATAADGVLGVLEMFPELMMLILEHKDLLEHIISYLLSRRSLFLAEEPSVVELDHSLELKTNFPSFSLLHLRTVELTWILHDTSIYPVIEFLLKNAHVLEKMVFRAKKLVAEPESSWILAEEKVKSMPRSSPVADVVIIKDKLSSS